MSPTVNQGLQSCLEPMLMEPRVFRFKQTPKEFNYSHSLGSSLRPCVNDFDPQNKFHKEPNNTIITSSSSSSTTKNNTHRDTINVLDSKSKGSIDMGGWSFLQVLNTTSQTNKQASEEDKVYIPPLLKRSSSKLSAKSLEMCTESLGSETGSESNDEISLLSSESENVETPKSYKNLAAEKRMKRSATFPPPLSSISCSTGVQMKPHREGGRLVLKAETITPCHTLFQAERSNGRLTLRLLQDPSPKFNQEDIEEEEEEEIEAEQGEGEGEEENCDGEDDHGVEIEGEEEEKEEEEGEGKSGKAKDEMGKRKVSSSRRSRCMEGGRGSKELLHWEPFWVAT